MLYSRVEKSITLLVPYVLFGIAHYLVSLILDGKSLLTLIHIFTCNTQGLTIRSIMVSNYFIFTDILYFFLDQLRKKWLIVTLVIIGSYADQILP